MKNLASPSAGEKTAGRNSASSVIRSNEKLMSSMDQLPLSALLVRLKVTRKASLRSRNLGHNYDEFSDVVCKLYTYLDQTSIEELESYGDSSILCKNIT
jgi:hypothetical protein